MKKKRALIKVFLLYNKSLLLHSFNKTQEIFDVKIANNHLGFASIEREVSREENWLCLHVLNQLIVCFLRASLQLPRSSSFCKLGKSYVAVHTRMVHHFAWCLRFKFFSCKDRKEKKISILLLEYSYAVLGLFCHFEYSLMLFFKLKQCVLIREFFFCFSSCSEHGFLLHLDKRSKL
jgi:hypothetical protein